MHFQMDRGEIEIDIKLDNRNYFIIVADNGVWFPEDCDLKDSDTLGLRIVNSLTEQIEGEIKLNRNKWNQIHHWI